jgi:hypothetical protein
VTCQTLSAERALDLEISVGDTVSNLLDAAV